MVEHVFRRAKLFPSWAGLYLATCDREIADVGEARGWPVVMTSDRHTRALDRVAEAAGSCGNPLDPDDVVVNVQGDEPMLHAGHDRPPRSAVAGRRGDSLHGPRHAHRRRGRCWRNPDTVKIIHDVPAKCSTRRVPRSLLQGHVHATPGARRQSTESLRFRWRYPQDVHRAPPRHRSSQVEACDSNRIFDHGFRQRLAPYPYRASFSVDSPADAVLVEAHLRQDELWGTY